MKNDTHNLEQLRHSAAHLLAHAVQELYPATKLTIGPATPEGFFYDFLPEQNFKEEDLPLLEEKMREISSRNLPIEHTQIATSKAREIFKDNPFKLELIDGINEQTVGLATQGNFVDLCRGGHVASTGDIKHFKLLSISGSYWRANRDGQALQRITGTAFFTQEELDEYEQRRQDALRYDHRRLAKELDLFSFHDEGVGFPFFHPHGKRIINLLVAYMRTQLDAAGYEEVSTPIMLSEELWKRSGHYEHFKDNMYFCCIEDKNYAVKPMNCPGAILIYKDRPHSYRELPLRLAEFGTVHRYELSGVLHGLFRVRAFTQDDAHIFCSRQQIEQEAVDAISMIMRIFKRFDFSSIKVGLSTKPANAMGEDALWVAATDALVNALRKANVEFEVFEGEGAFYGPKIEFHIQDSMGRTWQCGTVQLDFFMPENFDLSFINNQGAKERPVMIHRAIYGSLERFFGVLLEHYKGRLPFWLSPVQAKILTITDAQKDHARMLAATLKKAGLRVSVDESTDPLAGQIKTAQGQQIPWMLVIGKKEVEQNTITLRTREGGQEFGLTLEHIMAKAHELNNA